jgi:hypothetical protein
MYAVRAIIGPGQIEFIESPQDPRVIDTLPDLPGLLVKILVQAADYCPVGVTLPAFQLKNVP